MAFIKSKALPSGAVGEYWRILQRNSNFARSDDVVTVQLYISAEGRANELTPLHDAVQFNFTDADHPLSDFDPNLVDTADVDDFRDLELHVRYVHIKNIAKIAKALLDDEPKAVLSVNEQAALFFVDAIDA